MAESKSFFSRLNFFAHKHPIISTLILIFIIGLILVWLILSVFLGSWTRHGAVVRMPSVKGMNVEQADRYLTEQGYEVKLDSIFDSTGQPGIVLEQSPREDAVVKEGRTVYLTYACYSRKQVKVPVYTNMSRRQAIAAFEEIGVKNISVHEVPSEYPDLVISAKYNGNFLSPGTLIPVDANVVLDVGAAIFDEYGESYEELVLPEDDIEEIIADII